MRDAYWTFEIACLLQIAQDLCVEFFNMDFVKQRCKKADRLMTLSDFDNINKKIRQKMDKSVYEILQDKICEFSDEMSCYVDLIHNSFLEDAVKKFRYESCEPLAKSLTLTTIMQCADSIFIIMAKARSGRIKSIIERLIKIGGDIKVSALNESAEIDTTNAEKTLRTFLKTLESKSIEYVDKYGF